MTYRNLTLACVAVASLVLSSCAQWTESQKAKLSTVAVTQVQVAKDAYQSPLGAQDVQVHYYGQVGNGSFGQGAAVGAILALGSEIAEAIQQKMFESKYADAIAKAPQNLPTDLGKRAQTAFATNLAQQPFFRGKIQSSSPNYVSLSIEHYRYVRSGKADGEVLVRPVITGNLKVTAAGEKLLDTQVVGDAGSHTYPLTHFASNPKATSQAFDEAVQNLTISAIRALDAKTGVKPGGR
ncbi:hypothetical protein KBB96_14785 [Luteolibacter ambystomatis]|uniref:Lipoprotein n=1 Tax=Luteolibacter ambystomatis TaxID=2824561 RepID=A0A975IYH0_9BACT|nr:hypothetical protein [Luteolibacter ambystomatis]QUE50129.1 hypothetical protein KBB96_14785 [Luteolibacter ambystomatis]